MDSPDLLKLSKSSHSQRERPVEMLGYGAESVESVWNHGDNGLYRALKANGNVYRSVIKVKDELNER